MKTWALFIIVCITYGILLINSTDDIDSNTTIEEVVKARCSLKNYVFTSQQNGVKDYCIYVNEFNNCFRIKADFIDLFDKVNWEKDINKDSFFDIYYSKKVNDLLNQNQQIFIFSISGLQNKQYLSLEKTIEQQNKSNKFLILFGKLLIAIGIGTFILQIIKKHLKKLPISDSLLKERETALK